MRTGRNEYKPTEDFEVYSDETHCVSYISRLLAKPTLLHLKISDHLRQQYTVPFWNKVVPETLDLTKSLEYDETSREIKLRDIC